MNGTVEVALRAFFALIALFIITRLQGKKQLAQLTFFEYIVGITIGDITAFIATDVEGNLLHGYASLLVFAVIPFLIDFLSLKSKTVRDLFEGKGTVLIRKGKILEDNMKKEHFSTDELLEQLRLKDAFRVADVEFAVLEANGELSVMKKKESQPPSASDLGLTIKPEHDSQTVIMDGNILLEPLAEAGLNMHWLRDELEKAGVALDNVFLGQVDSAGELYLDVYDDKLEMPAATEQKLTLASLRKCQADLELFALETTDIQTQKLYGKASQKLEQSIKHLSPYLK